MSLLVRVVAILALAPVIAGCLGSTTEPAEPAAGPVPAVRSDAEIELPLDDYLLTAEQAYVVARAVNALGRACLTEFSLSWPQTQPWLADPQPRNGRRYSLIDAELARSEGYHPVALLARSREIAAREAAVPEPSADATAVWSGTVVTYAGRPVPAGGCQAEAERQLSENATVPDDDLAQRLQVETFQQAKADNRVQQAFTTWRRCMSGHGYRYTDPFAAMDDSRWRSTAEISAEEIAVAVADVECKQEANVAGVMLAVETDYQLRAIDRNAPRLSALRDHLTTQLTNARAVRTE